MRGPAPGGQHSHRTREGELRRAARSARGDGGRSAPGRRFADDRGNRRLTTTASQATERDMSESSPKPVIPAQRSYTAVFSDLDGGPTGERLRVDNVALRNRRRPNLATTSIRVGASYTSLDIWYIDLDMSADALSCFRDWLSDDELAK